MEVGQILILCMLTAHLIMNAIILYRLISDK